jgi:hypothetical protein
MGKIRFFIELLVVLLLLLMAACSFSKTPEPLFCGKYSASTVNNLNADGMPFWINYPGPNCAVGSANWGNTNKEQARKDAISVAKEMLTREIAPETIRVTSETEIKKKQMGKNVSISAVGHSKLEAEGEKVQMRTKLRSVWIKGYKAWVLVERLQ